MRCPYCYNPEIVLGKGQYPVSKVLDFLKQRQGMLDGVVFSGGECTLQPNLLFELAKQARQLGYQIKVDTNGTGTDVLRELADKQLLDYVALDFKSLPTKSRTITGRKDAFDHFKDSFLFLQKAQIPFEVRTTVHSHLISASYLQQMGQQLQEMGYQNTWFLQSYVAHSATIGDLGPSEVIDTSLIPKNMSIVNR